MLLEMDPPECQGMKVISIHFDEFDNKIRVIKRHVLKIELLCIVVLKVVNLNLVVANLLDRKLS